MTLFKQGEVFSYLQNHQHGDGLVFQKCSYSETWRNSQFTTAVLFYFYIFTAQRSEYNVIVRDSEPIRMLESPRSLSVYILILFIFSYCQSYWNPSGLCGGERRQSTRPQLFKSQIAHPYPVDREVNCAIKWIEIYPVDDSAIHNWSQNKRHQMTGVGSLRHYKRRLCWLVTSRRGQVARGQPIPRCSCTLHPFLRWGRVRLK